MQLYNGKETIQWEKEADSCLVFLTKTQYDASSIDLFQNDLSVEHMEEGIGIRYAIPEGAISFQVRCQQAQTRLEKLRLAGQLHALIALSGKYTLPFLHTETLYFQGEAPLILHSGIQEVLAPMFLEDSLFLQNMQALILTIFHPKLSYEQLLDGFDALQDAFSASILQAGSLTELFSFIRQEWQLEEKKVQQTKRLVSRKKYGLYRLLGVIGLLVGVVAVGMVLYFRQENTKQDAIISAQTSFLTQHYAKTQEELSSYSLDDLPSSAKYILAVSSVQLADLTATQKEAVLGNLSIKSNNNTLYYWASIGRGDFEEALNLAKNLGDEQLTLFAYTELYEATKLNTSMDGGKKQELLAAYTEQIQALTKKLGK